MLVCTLEPNKIIEIKTAQETIKIIVSKDKKKLFIKLPDNVKISYSWEADE